MAEIPRDLIEVRRRYLQAGGEPADRVAGSAPYPLTFRARLESGTTANALVEALNREMLDAEALLADTLSRDDSMLTLVDGPLRHLRSPGHRVVGYVKRIVRWYVDEAHRRLLPELPLAHRTPLFTITNQRGVDRYSWFLRIADLGPHYHPLGGITRLEAQGTLPLPQAVALADETAAALPPLASSLARDPRAPQNLTPVGALEATLTHRLGDREWVRRLIASALSAPSQATAEGRGMTANGAPPSNGHAELQAAVDATADVTGYVLGTEREAATPLDFWVHLDREHYLQLDDVVHVRSPLPDGAMVDLYGVVDEVRATHEGVRFASDVELANEGLLPVEIAVAAHVAVTRVEPEIYVPPLPGRAVVRATGDARERALFFDAMRLRDGTVTRFIAGLSRAGEPMYGNLQFLDGRRGAHVNISGISGVATKTSYAMFLLYALFEGGGLTGAAANGRAIVFNVKGEDLLFLDKENADLDDRDRARYASLGLPARPFQSVALFAPARRGEEALPDTGSRMDGVTPFYWTLHEFCARRYLRFLFADADDERSQLNAVVASVERELAHVAQHDASADGVTVRIGGHDVESFEELVELIDEQTNADLGGTWHGRAALNTVSAFMRRLEAALPHVGQLLRGRVAERDPDAHRNRLDA